MRWLNRIQNGWLTFCAEQLQDVEFKILAVHRLHLITSEGPFALVSLTCANNRDHQSGFVGIDKKTNVAFAAAISEYSEAVAQWQQMIPHTASRNGWAAHKIKTLAKQNAYRELIERDACLMHFFNYGLATKPLEPGWVGLANHKVSTVLLQSCDPELCVVMAGMIDPFSNAWILGSACHPNQSIARSKAIREVGYLFHFWFARKHLLPSQPPPDPMQRELISHQQASIEPLNDRHLQQIFENQSGGVKVAAAENILKQTRYAYRKLKNGRTVCQAQTPSLAALTFGKTWLSSRAFCEATWKARGLVSRSFGLHPFL